MLCNLGSLDILNASTPMDHRTIIASLTSEERDRLTAKSDIAGLAQLACIGARSVCSAG